MKTYLYAILFASIWISVFCFFAPMLMSANSYISVIASCFLIILSFPLFVWILRKVWRLQNTNINKLLEMLK